jgi:hypothetical protein
MRDVVIRLDSQIDYDETLAKVERGEPVSMGKYMDIWPGSRAFGVWRGDVFAFPVTGREGIDLTLAPVFAEVTFEEIDCVVWAGEYGGLAARGGCYLDILLARYRQQALVS